MKNSIPKYFFNFSIFFFHAAFSMTRVALFGRIFFEPKKTFRGFCEKLHKSLENRITTTIYLWFPQRIKVSVHCFDVYALLCLFSNNSFCQINDLLYLETTFVKLESSRCLPFFRKRLQYSENTRFYPPILPPSFRGFG